MIFYSSEFTLQLVSGVLCYRMYSNRKSGLEMHSTWSGSLTTENGKGLAIWVTGGQGYS